MASPEKKLITPEFKLHVQLVKELNEGDRSDQHLQALFELNERFKSVKDVMKDLRRLLKEWGAIHDQKEGLPPRELNQAIAEYAKKVVALENELLELEAEEKEVEEAWWKEQQATIKSLVAQKDPRHTAKDIQKRRDLKNATFEALALFKKNQEGQASQSDLHEYGRFKRQVIDSLAELAPRVQTDELDEAVDARDTQPNPVVPDVASEPKPVDARDTAPHTPVMDDEPDARDTAPHTPVFNDTNPDARDTAPHTPVFDDPDARNTAPHTPVFAEPPAPPKKKGFWGRIKEVFSSKEVQKKAAKTILYDVPMRALGAKAVFDWIGASPLAAARVAEMVGGEKLKNKVKGYVGEGRGDVAAYYKGGREAEEELEQLQPQIDEVVLALGRDMKERRAQDTDAELRVQAKLDTLQHMIAGAKNIAPAERAVLFESLTDIVTSYGEAQKTAEAALLKKTQALLERHVRNQANKLALVRDGVNAILTAAGLPMVRAVAYAGMSAYEAVRRVSLERKGGAAGESKKDAAKRYASTVGTAARESFNALLFRGRKNEGSVAQRGIEGVAAWGQALSVFGISVQALDGHAPTSSEGFQSLINAIKERGAEGALDQMGSNIAQNADRVANIPATFARGVGHAYDAGHTAVDYVTGTSHDTSRLLDGAPEFSFNNFAQENHLSKPEGDFLAGLLKYPSLRNNPEVFQNILKLSDAGNHNGVAERILGDVKMYTFKAMVDAGAGKEELAGFVRDQHFSSRHLEHLKGVHLGSKPSAEKIAEALQAAMGKKSSGVYDVFKAKATSEYQHALAQKHGDHLRLRGNDLRLYGFDKDGNPILGGKGTATLLHRSGGSHGVLQAGKSSVSSAQAVEAYAKQLGYADPEAYEVYKDNDALDDAGDMSPPASWKLAGSSSAAESIRHLEEMFAMEDPQAYALYQAGKENGGLEDFDTSTLVASRTDMVPSSSGSVTAEAMQRAPAAEALRTTPRETVVAAFHPQKEHDWGVDSKAEAPVEARAPRVSSRALETAAGSEAAQGGWGMDAQTAERNLSRMEAALERSINGVDLTGAGFSKNRIMDAFAAWRDRVSGAIEDGKPLDAGVKASATEALQRFNVSSKDTEALGFAIFDADPKLHSVAREISLIMAPKDPNVGFAANGSRGVCVFDRSAGTWQFSTYSDKLFSMSGGRLVKADLQGNIEKVYEDPQAFLEVQREE